MEKDNHKSHDTNHHAEPAEDQHHPSVSSNVAPSQVVNTSDQPVAAPESDKTNIMAVLSLVSSLIFFSLLGLVFGIVGLVQIKKTGEKGKGLAVAGIIISVIQIMITLMLIVLLILGAIAADVNETDFDELQKDSQSVNEQPAKATVKDPVQIGKVTSIGDYELKVISAKEFEQTEEFGIKPKSGSVFYDVEVEVTNNGFDTEYLYNSLFTVKDTSNNKYNYTTFAAPKDSSTVAGELASKETVRGHVGFEVPKSSVKSLTLYFEDPSYGGGSATVDLSK